MARDILVLVTKYKCKCDFVSSVVVDSEFESAEQIKNSTYEEIENKFCKNCEAYFAEVAKLEKKGLQVLISEIKHCNDELELKKNNVELSVKLWNHINVRRNALRALANNWNLERPEDENLDTFIKTNYSR